MQTQRDTVARQNAGDALVGIWGKDEFENVDVEPERKMTADEKLAHGPQLERHGISRDEIDKLFD